MVRVAVAEGAVRRQVTVVDEHKLDIEKPDAVGANRRTGVVLFPVARHRGNEKIAARAETQLESAGPVRNRTGDEAIILISCEGAVC